MTLRSALIFGMLLLFGVIWSYETARTQDQVLDISKVPIKKAPPCIRMYDYLQTYSEKYGVPFCIAYGVAHAETRYGGPFDWDYNPSLTSPAAAYGAMQIQVPTANSVWDHKRKITSKQLLTNLELNVETSIKLLAKLKERYGSWELALGCYNTGRPMVNGYAIEIMNSCKK